MRRRTFLGAGVVSLAGFPWSASFQKWVDVALADGVPLHVLTEAELKLLRALADTLFPEVKDGRLPCASQNILKLADGTEMDTALRIDAYLAKSPEDRILRVRGLLNSFQEATKKRFNSKHFEQLSMQERTHFLKAWQMSVAVAEKLTSEQAENMRRAYWKLKELVVFVYFANPSIWPLTGYKGPDFLSSAGEVIGPLPGPAIRTHRKLQIVSRETGVEIAKGFVP